MLEKRDKIIIPKIRSKSLSLDDDCPIPFSESEEEDGGVKSLFKFEIMEDANMEEALKKYIKDLVLTKYIINEPHYEEISRQVKEELDGNFRGRWHCIIGKAFGFEVSFESERLLYACIDDIIAVLIWKS